MNIAKPYIDATITTLCEYIDKLTKEENENSGFQVAENTKALALLVTVRTLADKKEL